MRRRVRFSGVGTILAELRQHRHEVEEISAEIPSGSYSLQFRKPDGHYELLYVGPSKVEVYAAALRHSSERERTVADLTDKPEESANP